MIRYYIDFLKDLKPTEKYTAIFWLLGPVIFMLGRFLADLWVTTIVVLFLFHCFINKDLNWLNSKWVKSIIFLVCLFLITSWFSENPFFCFSETLAWLRFPLFLVAVQILFYGKKTYSELILISIIFSLILMLIIGYTEAIFFNKTRLIWPFSNPIPGSYVAKALLPAIIFLSSIAIKGNDLNRIMSIILLFLASFYIFLTGERMSLIIVLSSIVVVFYLSSLKKMKILLPLIVLSILGLIILLIDFSSNELLRLRSERFTSELISNITDIQNSDYWAVWFSGINIFYQNPITGIGPAYMAEVCDTVPNQINQNISCQNHPHNYYIQMLAEIGFLGPLALLYFVFTVSKCCYEKNFSSPKHFFWFIPIILFFPLGTSGDFFAQTGNIFTWFSLSVALLCSGKNLFNKF